MDGVLSGLIDLAQAAALDQALWESWLDQAAQGIGAAGGLMTVLDQDEMALTQTLAVRRTAEMLSDYAAQWAPFDPLVAPASKATGAVVFTSLDYVDDERDGTRGYRAWERSFNIGHHAVIAAPLDGMRWKAGLSFHRDRADGITPDVQLGRLRALLPVVQQSMYLCFRANRLLDERFWDGICAVRAAGAVFLLDEQGRVIRATGAGLGVVGKRDGLAIKAGRLTAIFSADDARLAALMARALAQESAVGGAVPVGRSEGGRPYLLKVQPLARARRALAPFEAAALVTVVDPENVGQTDLEPFRRAFDLTPRETELSKLLYNGHSLESAAAMSGMAIATARLHLHHVFAKTGTARQPELMTLIAAYR